MAQCVVFGVSDHDATEYVHAAVVPTRGQQADSDDLHAYVTSHKGVRYAPNAVHVVSVIPRTPVGKPDRNKLRELIARQGA